MEKAIKEHVSLKEDQIPIYHLLCTLLIYMECEEAMFRSLLQEFLTQIYNKHESCCTYFVTNIVQCYNIGLHAIEWNVQ